jgi:hypothetical protein
VAQNVMSGLQAPAVPMFGTSGASGPSTPTPSDRPRNQPGTDTDVSRATTDLSHSRPAVSNAPDSTDETLSNNSRGSNESSDPASIDEQLSPKSLSARPKSDLAGGVADRMGRNEEDSPKNRPFSSGSDHRSNSVIRIPSTKSTASTKSKNNPEETDMPN